MEDLGPANKSKSKPTRVKLLTGRTQGFTALQPGAEITVPAWEADRMSAVGQCEILSEEK